MFIFESKIKIHLLIRKKIFNCFSSFFIKKKIKKGKIVKFGFLLEKLISLQSNKQILKNYFFYLKKNCQYYVENKDSSNL